MKDAYAEFQTLHRAWKTLRQSKPTETDFTPFGLKGGQAEDFDALFDEWETALSNAASKTKTAGADDKALETITVSIINQLNGLVSATPSNGYPWLIQSGFPAKISELNVALTPILDRRFRVRKAVIEAAQEDLNNDITRVENAAPLAEKLVEQQATISKQAGDIAIALQATESAESRAASAVAQIAQHLSTVQQTAQDVATSKATYEQTVSDANTLLGEAKAKLATITADRENADKQIVRGGELVAEANAKISKAISDLNRQGLAGSFDKSAKRLGMERIGWLLAFVAAIVYLVLMAKGTFSQDGGASGSFAELLKEVAGTTAPKQVVPFWERVLHFIPLAAPGIWLGWFAARNASLTARIQQDYTYKVATAQSFEAYKKEVEAVGDKTLFNQLLETTIRNFSDNPIRIYDGKGFEGHPLESLKSLLEDKHFDKLVKLIEAAKPGLK
ncbi:hypothetical protein [Lysobacter yangpyeongensis]|uniref:hypothetical protein n=1 Tax=Lysobacter yangpyeongensis TaxID=346182 RepID=UPI0036DD5ACC